MKKWSSSIFLWILLLLLNFPLKLDAQVPGQEAFANPKSTLSNIPKNITQIEVDQQGNIFLLETDNHKLHKYFKDAQYDSVLTIGGKGFGGEGFNLPTEIVVQNRQNIYVLDEMNRRLVLLNTNLKVTREVNFLSIAEQLQDESFEDINPSNFAVTPAGDLFLLNQNNLKIYKLNIFGNLTHSFGGLDYGLGSISDLGELVTTTQNNLLLSDTESQKILVYDLYGTYQHTIHTHASFIWKGIVTLENFLICFGDHDIYMYNLFSKQDAEFKLSEESLLIDLESSKDYFYLLFENKVNLYAY